LQTSPAVEQIKTLNGLRVRGISPVGKGKVCGGNDLPKIQVLSSEWNTQRAREDASDGEDNDNDKLPCVAGESEGDCISLQQQITLTARTFNVSKQTI